VIAGRIAKVFVEAHDREAATIEPVGQVCIGANRFDQPRDGIAADAVTLGARNAQHVIRALSRIPATV
jgi:hypothetical protein